MTGVNKAELRRLTIHRDMMGTIHIKAGDFDYVQIQYQYPYTDNASTQRLAEQVVAILEGSSEVEKLRAERDAALAELEACRKDAELYRWVSGGVQEAETLVSVVLCHGGDAAKITERIATYMEANQEVRNG